MQVFASGRQIFLFDDAIAITVENEENVGIAKSVHEIALLHGFSTNGDRVGSKLGLVESIKGNPLSIGGLGIGIIGRTAVDFSSRKRLHKNFGDVVQGNQRIGVAGSQAKIRIKSVFDFELPDGHGVLAELAPGFCRQHGSANRGNIL